MLTEGAGERFHPEQYPQSILDRLRQDLALETPSLNVPPKEIRTLITKDPNMELPETLELVSYRKSQRREAR